MSNETGQKKCRNHISTTNEKHSHMESQEFICPKVGISLSTSGQTTKEEIQNV